MYASRKTVLERFNAKWEAVTESGCWLWTGASYRGGYGHMGKSGSMVKAHRVSYELFKGSVPNNLLVCHHCDVPCCVNPDHLFLGTQQDNTNDKVRKGRVLRGIDISNSVLTENDIRNIKFNKYIYTQKELAELFNTSRPQVSRILSGKIWKHI